MKQIGEVSASADSAVDEDGADFQRDLPFLFIACLLHTILLAKNPGFSWSVEAQAAEPAIAVEIVKEIPKPPSPMLAPMAPGTSKKDEAFHHGPGPIKLEKIKHGSPRAKAAHKKKIDPAVLAILKARKLERQRKALERMMAEQQRRREVAEQRRIVAEKRAEERRVAAEKLAEERRILAEKRAEERRIAAERRRQFLAEQARIQQERRADVERQLATLSNPDEAISDASGGDVPPGAGGPSTGKIVGKAGGNDQALASSGMSAAAADVGGDFAADGRDALNMKASGGGIGHGDGGPVSWYLEGTAGNRKLLKRIVPPCPDWVSSRGLDLTVQLKFRVLENGEIKDAVIVKKTSGFPDLDQLAISTIRKWKFEGYHGKAGEKVPAIWGVVSFRFVAA